ncbi:MAG: glycosyl hydrolase family protein, partial [Mesorhizobium sp.]
MNTDPKSTSAPATRGTPFTRPIPGKLRRLHSDGALLLIVLVSLVAGLVPVRAQDLPTAPSFVDDFTSLSRARWFISDGWTNGKHQNCTWSKKLVELSDGVLTLGFEKRKLKDRDFACGEIQTKQRFGYGTYEARMKTDAGSGINAAFFSYIGPSDKQPWDEIDFEVLTKDTSKVQVNAY